MPFPGREVQARIWLAQVGRIKLYLLDTDLPENREDDRWITGHLYGGDQDTRIRQEIVLGIGGLVPDKDLTREIAAEINLAQRSAEHERGVEVVELAFADLIGRRDGAMMRVVEQQTERRTTAAPAPYCRYQGRLIPLVDNHGVGVLDGSGEIEC